MEGTLGTMHGTLGTMKGTMGTMQGRKTSPGVHCVLEHDPVLAKLSIRITFRPDHCIYLIVQA